MVDRIGIRRNSKEEKKKKKKITKSYTGQEIEESHDYPRPEGIRQIKNKDL